jgi:hypothetical protein
MKQEIITVFGKKYKAVAKFSNREADMIEIEPLTEVDELKDRIESLESKIKALETILTTLVDDLNNERERNKLYNPKNDINKEIEDLYYAGKGIFNKTGGAR